MHLVAHKIPDHLFQQGIVGTAQNQRVNARVLQLLQILRNDQLCDRVAVVEIAVFDQRHKHRAGAGKNLHVGHHVADDGGIRPAAHRGCCADDADFAVPRRVHRRAGRSTHNAGKRHGQPGGLLRRIGRGHRAAGGNDKFHVLLQ